MSAYVCFSILESLNININNAQAQMIAAMGMVLNRNEDRNYVPINRNNDNLPDVGAVLADDLLGHMRNVGVHLFDGQNINIEAPIQRRGFPGGEGRRNREQREGIVELPRVLAEGEENPNPNNQPGAPIGQLAAVGGAGSGSANSPSSANSELCYSGLYSYHVPTNTWTLLRCDVATPKPTRPVIRSRVGHSMLFHPGLRKLFIFAGQRSKEYLNDFFSYNVDTDEIEVISDGHKKIRPNSPSAGFTQRATIDPELNEIYIFSVSIIITKEE